MQLKEIRLVASAPNIGVPTFASRRETSSFMVGTDGVTSIELDSASGVVTIVTSMSNPNGGNIEDWLVLPFSACKWVRPLAPVRETKPVGRQKAR